MPAQVARRSPRALPEEVPPHSGASPALLLAVLGAHAMRLLREAHTRHSLTPRQVQILGLLHHEGATAQRALGQTLELDPSVLVMLLNPLESDGLIARVRAAEDRRRHLVSITAEGERRLTGAEAAQREVEERLFAGFDEGEREHLRTLLSSLQQSVAARCTQTDAAELCCEEATPAGGRRGRA